MLPDHWTGRRLHRESVTAVKVEVAGHEGLDVRRVQGLTREKEYAKACLSSWGRQVVTAKIGSRFGPLLGCGEQKQIGNDWSSAKP